MVFYRKYRPQLISELDLVAVREKLTSILSSNNIPHAFLFAGPKGLGKTSSARILAKAINCEKKGDRDQVLGDRLKKEKSNLKPSTYNLEPSVEPCNTCSACLSITNNSNVDVLEIDAASNRGIDEIRDLRDRIKFSPASLRKKVYIIDEVHMLTAEAFNALLKTLEEPPAHAVFILCTTETHKLPATIMSRVFLVQFEKPTTEELARSLERVVAGENLDVEDGVLGKIAELSDGAFRDGTKILEELSLQSNGKKITLELLEKLYKAGSIDNSVEKILEVLRIKDVKRVLKEIEGLATINADFKQVIEKMADKLHGELLVVVSKGDKGEMGDLQKLLELIDVAYKGLRGAVLPQLPLELCVIGYCLEENAEESALNKVKPSSASVKVKPSLASVKVKPSTSSWQASGSNVELFRQLVDSVNQENKILAGLLRGCKIENIDNNSVTIKAPSTFHLGKLTEKQNSDVIKLHIDKILQKHVAIEIQ